MAIAEIVTLESIGDGAASEMFQDALQKIIENVINPNTKPDAVRSITLKVKVKPGKNDRTLCQVEVTCDPKLVPVNPFLTAMFVGVQNGNAQATEYNPKQRSLFETEEAIEQPEQKPTKVVAMNGAR